MSWDCIHHFFPYTAHLKLILSITSLPTNCLMPSLTVISGLSSPETIKMETHRKAGLGSFLLTFHDSCNQLWSYRHMNPRSWAQGNTKTWQTVVGGAVVTNAIMVLLLSWKYLVSVLHKAVRKSGACFLLRKEVQWDCHEDSRSWWSGRLLSGIEAELRLNEYEVAGDMVTSKKTKDRKGLCTVQDIQARYQSNGPTQG